MKKPINIKKLLLPNVPYAIIALLGTKLGLAWRLAEGADIFAKLLGFLTTGLGTAFSSPIPSFHPVDLLVGITVAGIIRLVVYVKGRNAKKYRKNMEYGSARWGAYYLLKELLYGRKRRKRHDRIQQDHRAILPSFSR